MFLGIHAGGDQRQKVRAVPGRAQTTTVSFSDHARVYVPPPERPSFDVLRTEGLGQIHGSLDVVWIRFGLDTLPLLTIECVVALELKTAVTDSRPGQHPGCYVVRICDHWSHRRSLIAHCGDAEIEETGEQVATISVSMKIH